MKYKVTFTVRETHSREVEADSAAEAKRMVQESNRVHLRRDLGQDAEFTNYQAEEIKCCSS